jgi:succinyl-diaminopimelate desuccinylase
MSLQKQLVTLTKELIKSNSLTPVTKDLLPEASRSLDIIEKFFKKNKPTIKRLTFSGDHPKWSYAVDNLYLEWSWGKPEKHLCFIGHTDVVPPGDITSWSVDPFSADEKKGFIYGRGSTDMKGAVAAYCCAIKNFIEVNNINNLKLSLIITTDEEWAAVNGVKKVLSWMKDKGIKPDAFIVGEPSSLDHIASDIKIGRRGSLCGTLEVKGVQGHAAYNALFVNPNRALTLAMTILHTLKWNDGDKFFPNTNFENIALNSGNFGATAIIPGEARALWNIRYTTKHTPNSLEKQLNKILKSPPTVFKKHPDFKLLKNVQVVCNKSTASIPYYSKPKKLALLAQKTIKSKLGIKTGLDAFGGTTDARFIHHFFPKAEVIELGLPEKGGFTKDLDYGKKGGMHQIDEKVSIKDLTILSEIYNDLIKNYYES